LDHTTGIANPGQKSREELSYLLHFEPEAFSKREREELTDAIKKAIIAIIK
jgi:hypothetical protein